MTDSPFIDESGEHPTAIKRYGSGNRCYYSSEDGGECDRMGVSFDDYDEWRDHTEKFHPVACGASGCAVLAAYRKDGSPHSMCFEHIPDDPDVVYAWSRTNTESVVEPPKADDDHPIEAALEGVSG